MLYKPLIKQPFGTTDGYNVFHRKMATKTLICPGDDPDDWQQ